MPAILPRPLPARQSRWMAGAVVLGLHGLALLALLRLGAWGERGPVARPQPPLMLRWLSDGPRAAAAAPVRVQQQQQQQRPPAAATATAAQPSPRQPEAISAPAAEQPAAEQPQPRPPTPVSPPTATDANVPPATVPPLLNLALPRAASAAWRQRPPAMDDSRANTPPATLESRLAAALGGDGSWVPQRLGNDGDTTHVRYRRGNLCIDVYKARQAQLNPFNQSFSPTPAQATGALPC